MDLKNLFKRTRKERTICYSTVKDMGEWSFRSVVVLGELSAGTTIRQQLSGVVEIRMKTGASIPVDVIANTLKSVVADSLKECDGCFVAVSHL